jgi:hypothetical protein
MEYCERESQLILTLQDFYNAHEKSIKQFFLEAGCATHRTETLLNLKSDDLEHFSKTDWVANRNYFDWPLTSEYYFRNSILKLDA